MKRRSRINLLPTKEKTFGEKAYYFVFNYLRYVIVITQLVVVIVFFYRFQIDQEIIDLKDEINQKNEIIKTARPLIEEAKLIGKKTKSVENILINQQNLEEIFNYLTNIFPKSATLRKLDYKENGLEIEGFTMNVNDLKKFHKRLESENKFKTVQLKSLLKNKDRYVFNIFLTGYQGFK